MFHSLGKEFDMAENDSYDSCFTLDLLQFKLKGNNDGISLK